MTEPTEPTKMTKMTEPTEMTEVHLKQDSSRKQDSYRKRILIFDVETSGLMPRADYTKPPPPVEAYPYILQISFVIYDLTNWRVERMYNTYIRVAPSVEISPFITELTGITREKCDNGVPIVEALTEFYNEYRKSDMIVAHNIDFDKAMITLEMQRNAESMVSVCPHYSCVFSEMYNKLNNVEIYCTMKSGKNLCNIMVKPANKIDATTGAEIESKTYKKFPKLSELHEFLFNETPKNLHDSMVDTIVCLRCLLLMRFKHRDRGNLGSL